MKKESLAIIIFMLMLMPGISASGVEHLKEKNTDNSKSLGLLNDNNITQYLSPDILWSVDGHDNSVYSITFSLDNGMVASGAGDGTTKLWDASDGTLLKTFPGHDSGVVSVDLSPDGQYISVGYITSGYPPGGLTKLWDISQEIVVDTIGGAYNSISNDGEFIVSGGGGAVRYLYVHRISNGQEIFNAYHGSYISDIDFSPDGQIVASCGTDNTIKLWDATNGDILNTLTGHTDDVSTITFSPDGQLIASGAGGYDDPGESTIKIWRVSDGQLLDTYDGFDNSVFSVDFSPDGQYLISSGRDGSSPNYHLKIKFWRIANGMLVLEYDDSASAYDVKYSSDGQFFSYGSPYGEVAVAYNPNQPNSPPDEPEIEGETSGSYGVEYEYIFVTNDPNEDDVYFWIEWDDGEIEEWIGPFDSDEEIIVTHTFEEGTYIIKAKAKDLYNAESEWKYLEVSMPVNLHIAYNWNKLNYNK